MYYIDHVYIEVMCMSGREEGMNSTHFGLHTKKCDDSEEIKCMETVQHK